MEARLLLPPRRVNCFAPLVSVAHRLEASPAPAARLANDLPDMKCALLLAPAVTTDKEFQPAAVGRAAQAAAAASASAIVGGTGGDCLIARSLSFGYTLRPCEAEQPFSVPDIILSTSRSRLGEARPASDVAGEVVAVESPTPPRVVMWSALASDLRPGSMYAGLAPVNASTCLESGNLLAMKPTSSCRMAARHGQLQSQVWLCKS